MRRNVWFVFTLCAQLHHSTLACTTSKSHSGYHSQQCRGKAMDISCLSMIGSQTLCVVFVVCSMGSRWKNLEGAVWLLHHSMLLQLLLIHSALVSSLHHRLNVDVGRAFGDAGT